ncbi:MULTISPECIES: RCC1 repeat- and reductase domain-containing protein [Candidatus Kuenenia]|uniref:RCC1 domain-containing protein n=1 Tax=Candidatus Kuenenia TaxID=380738 RepID=UPI0028F44636|nr:RCC1 repeat- and reductase domain-containing protein [Candidatus Kuenenia stuttgartiensis]
MTNTVSVTGTTGTPTPTTTTEPKVAAGDSHTLALKYDGTVWTWGHNGDGQLGDGTFTNRTTPVQVNDLSDVIAIDGGQHHHSLAVKSDGTVWAWGHNDDGHLGDRTYTNRSSPVKVTDLSGAIAVAGGDSHSLALKSDGTVWAWGANWYGQLGDGTTADSTTPVQVSNLSDVIAIAGGDNHSLALKYDGTVWAWGENAYGKLGDETETNRTAPVQVGSLSNVNAIAVGDQHSLALKSDGTVWAWGNNEGGQLGDGTTTNRNTPIQVNFYGQYITTIAAGYKHNLAVDSEGYAWAWGYGWDGQLGDGANADSYIPVQVIGLRFVTAIVAGDWHSIAVKSDGTVWAWGYNGDGELGDGTTSSRSTPAQVDINLGQASDCGETNIMSWSAAKLKIKRKKSKDITITAAQGDVIEDDNTIFKCPVEGLTVTAVVDSKTEGKKLISVSPTSAVTDENGDVTFTIKAKNKKGNAKVYFSIEEWGEWVTTELSVKVR